MADDNEDFVTVVKSMLNESGYEVECAYDGQEVLESLRTKRPDLIILDVKMPDMDGLKVLAEVKKAPETASIPVILLTGKVQYRDILQGYQLGSDYYISKPFTRDQLMNGVELFLAVRS